MTAKWFLKITHGTVQYVYGPYGQKRAEELSMKMNAHFEKQPYLIAKRALALPMSAPGITELRRQHR